MKRIFLIILASIITVLAFAQEKDSIIVLQSPKSRLSGLIDVHDLTNESYNYWDEKFKGHWSGVEFGFNGFANADYSLYPASENHFLDNDLVRSNVLNLNILQYSKGIQQTRNNIGLVTGVGLSFQSYHLDNNTTISIDENQKIHPSVIFYDSSQKSKLSITYIEVPILLEFQIPIRNKANRLYFSAGLTGAKKLESHSKMKYHKDGKREKLKSPDDYSIKDYKVAATLRMGYRCVNLFATYDLAPLFEDRKGPVLYPFSAGFKLLSF
jgi:hypothetical protein